MKTERNTPKEDKVSDVFESSFGHLMTKLRERGYAEIFRQKGKQVHYIKFQIRIVFEIENNIPHFYLVKILSWEPIMTEARTMKYDQSATFEQLLKLLEDFSTIKN